MSRKTAVYLGVLIFSTIGGSIPLLFGASFLSYSSIIGNAIGGIIGIWVGFKITE